MAAGKKTPGSFWGGGTDHLDIRQGGRERGGDLSKDSLHIG